MSSAKLTKLTQDQIAFIRNKAEQDLEFFAELVNPHRVYGEVHRELFRWWTRETRKANQLALLPRGHQKSHCAAVKAAWDITRNPCVTILYVSATSQLAEAQLYAIKNILTSDVYRVFWPEMVHEDDAKREKWNNTEIMVDHPSRREEGIRDFTVAARGVTSNITGLHADVIYLDDLVVPNNAYTEEGREKVAALYSQLASIKNPDASTLAVGTRYHIRDLYATLLERHEDIYDENTNEIISQEPIYELFERVVEEEGVFLWPRGRRSDGKFFGFDRKSLERIRAEYIDTTQFYAQYYNNPNDPESNRISRDKFQYYDKKYLVQEGLTWYFNEERLNVFAAVDFAFSLSKAADFTAIVVVGVDCNNQIYVLDIDRFKTDKISVYFKHIVDLYKKWNFRKLRAEISVGQAAIVRELKDAYIRPNGLAFSIDEFRPTSREGTKEERIRATLEPRYDNQTIWHYQGGNCNLLEEEIILARPPHDDIKDALTAAIDIAIPPVKAAQFRRKNNVYYDSRFGGTSFRT